MTTETRKPNTPGYNCRLGIYFTTSRTGRRMAFRYSFRQMRAFRMPMAEAELLLATEQADRLDDNPWRTS